MRVLLAGGLAMRKENADGRSKRGLRKEGLRNRFRVLQTSPGLEIVNLEGTWKRRVDKSLRQEQIKLCGRQNFVN